MNWTSTRPATRWTLLFAIFLSLFMVVSQWIGLLHLRSVLQEVAKSLNSQLSSHTHYGLFHSTLRGEGTLPEGKKIAFQFTIVPGPWIRLHKQSHWGWWGTKGAASLEGMPAQKASKWILWQAFNGRQNVQVIVPEFDIGVVDSEESGKISVETLTIRGKIHQGYFQELQMKAALVGFFSLQSSIVLQNTQFSYRLTRGRVQTQKATSSQVIFPPASKIEMDLATHNLSQFDQNNLLLWSVIGSQLHLAQSFSDQAITTDLTLQVPRNESLDKIIGPIRVVVAAQTDPLSYEKWMAGGIWMEAMSGSQMKLSELSLNLPVVKVTGSGNFGLTTGDLQVELTPLSISENSQPFWIEVQQSFREWVAQAKDKGWVIPDGTKYRLKVTYDKNQVFLNDHPYMPEASKVK